MSKQLSKTISINIYHHLYANDTYVNKLSILCKNWNKFYIFIFLYLTLIHNNKAMFYYQIGF